MVASAMLSTLTDLFVRSRPLIALVHTGPSPGVPGFVCVESAVDRAVAEADVYLRAGVDGLLLENRHDVPGVTEERMGPEVAAFMTRVAVAIKRRWYGVPLGVHVRARGCRTALAVAVAAGCDFVRAPGWARHLREGRHPEAGALIRYRHHIDAGRVAVLTDLLVPGGAEPSADDLDLAMTVDRLADLQADGIILTTDQAIAPSKQHVQAVSEASALPVLVGSGLSAETVGPLYPWADGFIAGNDLKEGGEWSAPVSEDRVEALVAALDRARTAHQARISSN